MKKINSEVRKQAFELFNEGLELIEISRQLNIPEGTVRSWKNRYKWQRNDATQRKKKEDAPLQRKRGGQPGNKNGVGHGAPKGNKNALKHGVYSRYLPEETREIIESLDKSNPLDVIWELITIQYAAIIRAQQIMYVKDQSDKTIEKIGYTDGKTIGETWTVQEAWDKHASFLTAQSKAIAELRGSIKTYLELEGQSKSDAKQNAEDWKTAIIEIAKRRGEQHE